MKSGLHKVLHPSAGRAMLDHLGEPRRDRNQADGAGGRHGREQLEKSAGTRVRSLCRSRTGHGHAVQQAQAALADFDGDVLVLYCDVPFVRANTMRPHASTATEATPAGSGASLPRADPAAYGGL